MGLFSLSASAGSQTRSARRRLLPAVLPAGAALVAASWAGLARLGLRVGDAPIALHGPLMILGFLGTVISVERAVGLGRPWAWWAPLLSAGGTVGLLVGQSRIGLILLLGAGVALTAVYGTALRIGRYPAHLLVEGLGALSWVAAVSALLAGVSTPRAVPSLAGFLILTIIGERLELSRMGPSRSPLRKRTLVGVAATLMVSAAVSTYWAGEPVTRLSGALLLGLVLLSVSGDIARRTVRFGGVTGYMAWAILAGYLWLAVAATLWLGGGLVAGTTLYDPSLHSLFVGFVLSMIFGHAPVIVPAVARIDLPFHRSWWLAFWALHVTLLMRVTGALTGATPIKTVGGAGNVVALALFIVLAAMSGWRGAHGRAGAPEPT